jgi:hypothetical protein
MDSNIQSQGGIVTPATSLTITDATGVPQSANSEPEIWIAETLTERNLRFYYQVAHKGGRRFPGGFIADFIVLSALESVIEYLGFYYHQGRDEWVKWRWLGNEYDLVLLITDTEFIRTRGNVQVVTAVTKEEVQAAVNDYII